MAELFSLTASELAPLIETKQLSPVELTDSLLNRLDEIDPAVNAYITPLHDIARQQAQHAENEIMNGLYKGSLHGIPIGIKDNYYTKGIQTTAGSKLFERFIPDETSTVVKKLLAAGGIMLGKLNMHEFGGGLTNTNPFFGNSKNPWNLEYTPGGSSGGSSAALAAGLATLTTGTDTFGSIRVPAAMCGVYGLKPTYGLVSTKGIVPLSWTLDHAGPMARSVSDLALMLQQMAGYDPDDPGSIKTTIPDYKANLSKGIKGLKIGIPTHFLKDLDPEVATHFNNAVKKLESLGAKVSEVHIPELSMSTFAGYVIMSGEASTFHYNWLQKYPEDYADDVRILFQTGIITNTPQYIQSQQVRRLLTEAFKKTFEDLDVLAGPIIPVTTPRFQTNWIEQNLELIQRCMPFTAPATLTGTPSLTVPIGLDSNKLPIGMQLISNHLSEKLLLQVGSAWEETDPLDINQLK